MHRHVHKNNNNNSNSNRFHMLKINDENCVTASSNGTSNGIKKSKCNKMQQRKNKLKDDDHENKNLTNNNHHQQQQHQQQQQQQKLNNEKFNKNQINLKQPSNAIDIRTLLEKFNQNLQLFIPNESDDNVKKNNVNYSPELNEAQKNLLEIAIKNALLININEENDKNKPIININSTINSSELENEENKSENHQNRIQEHQNGCDNKKPLDNKTDNDNNDDDEDDDENDYDYDYDMKLNDFLDVTKPYNNVKNFKFHKNHNDFIFTLPIKNVQKTLFKYINSDDSIHLIFCSTAYNKNDNNNTENENNLKYYSFYVAFDSSSTSPSSTCQSVKIDSMNFELNKKNVILKLKLQNYENCKYYLAGIDRNQTERYHINDHNLNKEIKQAHYEDLRNDQNMETSSDHSENDGNVNDDIDKDYYSKKDNDKHTTNNDTSMSSNDLIKSKNTNNTSIGDNIKIPFTRRFRSMSESYTDKIPCKGILKYPSNQEIPEETIKEKKSVRFNDAVRKQLFRTDSSILGQRKRNQKRKSQKQRAIRRRNSEGDSTNYTEAPNVSFAPKAKKSLGGKSSSSLDNVSNTTQQQENKFIGSEEDPLLC